VFETTAFQRCLFTFFCNFSFLDFSFFLCFHLSHFFFLMSYFLSAATALSANVGTKRSAFLPGLFFFCFANGLLLSELLTKNGNIP